MDAKRVVRMKNGKYAVQVGWYDKEHECMDWDFETFIEPPKGVYERLLFHTEHDANKHVQAWVEENQISEICMEVYINEER